MAAQRLITSFSEAQKIAISTLQRFQSNKFVKTQRLSSFQDHLLRLCLEPYTPTKMEFNTRTLPQFHHSAFFPQFAVPEREIGSDGTDTQFNAPSPFCKRMYAGGSLEWGPVDPKLEDVLSEHTEIESVSAKERKGSVPMLVVGLKKTFRPTVQIGEFEFEADMSKPSYLVERRQWVFMQIDKSEEKKEKRLKQMEEEKSDFSYSTKITSTGIFRYSAIMYNAHRIHLDRKYATEVEKHPSILVQGWFTLQLMAMTYCKAWGDKYGNARVKSVKYRAVQPLYMDEEVTFGCNLEKGICWAEKNVDNVKVCVMKADMEMY